jgi:transposase
MRTCVCAEDPEAEAREASRRRTLLADLRELPWVAAGAKYGVSDNAVRKWVRRYEAERSEISEIAA